MNTASRQQCSDKPMDKNPNQPSDQQRDSSMDQQRQQQRGGTTQGGQSSDKSLNR